MPLWEVQKNTKEIKRIVFNLIVTPFRIYLRTSALDKKDKKRQARKNETGFFYKKISKQKVEIK